MLTSESEFPWNVREVTQNNTNHHHEREEQHIDSQAEDEVHNGLVSESRRIRTYT